VGRSAGADPNIGQYRTYLDSANQFKKTDLEKSIDYVTQSISTLGRRGNNEEIANALTLLGEVYEYHGLNDLAISNYEDAQNSHKTTRTALLLGRVLVLNKNYSQAEEVLLPLLDIKNMVPYQRVVLHEILGDVFQNQNLTSKAIAYYEEGLKIAEKNQIAPKLPDLNSKIADAYAGDNKLQEAKAYYDNSLEQASDQAPKRAVREKEKVADFYNRSSQFDEEIQLRKESLKELEDITPGEVAQEEDSPLQDSITTQQINYKIGRAYVEQEKFDEAIPYLEKSIQEANNEDDLIIQKDATRKLSEVYNEKGNYTKALETYQKYVTVVDTLYKRKEQEIANAARFNREIASKQSRISGLEQERELSQSKYDLAITEQRLVQESNRRQQWIIYSLLLGFILMGLAAFFFYRSNKQQQLANNLLALKSLRSQMNPHFIFNALNSVNNYIAKSDERSANRYLSEFSTLMRAVLDNSEKDFINLAKEMELLDLYVKLEHSRFPDKFDYTIDVDKQIDLEDFQIPPMLLQPYIENAIWHGLRYKEEKGWLKISLNKLGSSNLEIRIADNGIGRTKSAALKTDNQKKQKSQGMGNIRKRITILNKMYKDTVQVHINNLYDDKTGTEVIMTLKKSA
jgi:tetratricopeptide (TPR) repeat protein